MRVLIEEYRGWEIYFNTEMEDFYVMSEGYDYQESKRSYASAKKHIDDYIKANFKFKPVMVMRDSSWNQNNPVIKLVGIRKDKKFTYEDADGSKHILSEYSEKDYYVVNPINDPILGEISKIDQRINLLRKEVKELEARIIKVNVKDMKKDLLASFD